VVAGGRDDRDTGGIRHHTQQVGTPPEPDRRHVDDGADPARHALTHFRRRPLEVLELVARQRGRGQEDVVVGIDHPEARCRHRAGHRHHLAILHDARMVPARPISSTRPSRRSVRPRRWVGVPG
jgi:hypothetical protein